MRSGESAAVGNALAAVTVAYLKAGRLHSRREGVRIARHDDKLALAAARASLDGQRRPLGMNDVLHGLRDQLE